MAAADDAPKDASRASSHFARHVAARLDIEVEKLCWRQPQGLGNSIDGGELRVATCVLEQSHMRAMYMRSRRELVLAQPVLQP